jgi:spore coat protein A, manganese oxidase
MSPAERADVVVDFSQWAGQTITLLNLGPDEPFGGGEPGVDFAPADPDSTGQVLQFRVTLPLSGTDTSADPALGQLVLPAITPLGAASYTRQVSLSEMMSMYPGLDGPIAAMLGTVENGEDMHRMWDDPITEHPALGATEVWEIFNFTEDAHPIHVHEVMFQVVNRQPIDGVARPPEAWESGFKDTVIAYPGEITRIKATFDLAGLYVWHCHIVEHEDNEMMRPYRIG